MMRKLITTLILLYLTSMVSGCGTGMQAQEVPPVQIGQQALVDQTNADNAKKVVLAMEEVLEVKGVVYDDKIYVAPRVKHFDRLRLESIRKTGYERVNKRFPDEKVFFSTDKKIFMELEKLEQRLKASSIKEEELEKKLTKLEEDMKG
ncbi:YhcN/YlaJ family sporulation lipoprotein [Bacillus sp. FJAT-45350]|uniref:YhcN/YlaJ family sporulation lipoprotein n=1 Tax=Bacillus sp. FJAT-45350 TaxID=2011014 RepID=UPI000BB8855C|nr:YhcN/YlaJ family sporulation lipoprotein [Bacillus sp. FJAT-45350]